MTAFRVDATFSNGVPLGGTIEVISGKITAIDLTVPTFANHFTKIYFNQAYESAWLLSAQTPGSCGCWYGEEDYLTFTFTPGPSAFGQAKILNGVVVHNIYGAPGTSRTEYFGLGLGGTICPFEGCAPWPLPPPKGVPGPVAGSGLLATALLLSLLLRSRS